VLTVTTDSGWLVVRVAGANEHAIPLDKPGQASATVPLNPGNTLRVTAELTEPPGFTVFSAEEAIEKFAVLVLPSNGTN